MICVRYREDRVYFRPCFHVPELFRAGVKVRTMGWDPRYDGAEQWEPTLWCDLCVCVSMALLLFFSFSHNVKA